jgi:hypothetical protein
MPCDSNAGPRLTEDRCVLLIFAGASTQRNSDTRPHQGKAVALVQTKPLGWQGWQITWSASEPACARGQNSPLLISAVSSCPGKPQVGASAACCWIHSASGISWPAQSRIRRCRTPEGLVSCRNSQPSPYPVCSPTRRLLSSPLPWHRGRRQQSLATPHTLIRDIRASALSVHHVLRRDDYAASASSERRVLW